MSLAICDQGAFYPFRALVEGRVGSQSDLANAERFARTVVLHDEIAMELEPWPYDAESDPGFTDEEEAIGMRNVIVAIGPTLDGYGFFADLPRPNPHLNMVLSAELLDVARTASRAEPGEPYYKAHVEYLQRIAGVISDGGSALVAGDFGREAIDRAAEYPAKLFDKLDADWQAFARATDAGDVGIVVPPVVAILLTRAATRDALPTVLADLRDELADARRKVWRLLAELKGVHTLADAAKIKRELEAASAAMSPASPETPGRPTRVLWNLVGSALSGAVTAGVAHGDPLIGGALGAAKAASAELASYGDLGRWLFSRGAFDLARRVRSETLKIEPGILSRHLSAKEMARLERR
jgi:hypothetical protein